MKKINIIRIMLLLMLAGCSSDDENIVGTDNTDINVLLIQSDYGKISTGLMYKSGDIYNAPHCWLGREIKHNDNTSQIIYHMSFGANIKGSDVFNMVDIDFESNQPMSFKNLNAGDTFDSNKFHASASYTPTWSEKVMKQTTALSGKVKVIGTKETGDKSYLVLRLINLQFNAIDRSCVYTVNGIVEYEIWEI